MKQAIKAYIDLFENLDIDRINKMENFVEPNVTFIDPFNHLTDLNALKRLLSKTLSDVQNPKFKVLAAVQLTEFESQNTATYCLKWHFSGHINKVGLWEVEGISEIKLSQSEKICWHKDYWDASEHFYMKIPLLGTLIRFIRRRLQA
ncbi:MAG: nuclear transport factor 2 family protein [Alphaproteobacteria bacterium]|nr:nuclear transport factor 2 family protein [Alphaproteobacteria bacterium]